MFGDTTNYDTVTNVDFVTFDYTDGSSLISSTAFTIPVSTPIPEPTSLALLGLGGLVFIARRKR